MNILILANRDIASNHALNLLLPQLGDHRLSLFLSSSVGSPENKPEALKRLKFYEQDLFNQLLSPLLNQHKNPTSYKTFGQISQWLITPAETVNAINSPDELRKIRRIQPDLIISIRYGHILKDDVLSIPSLGVLNLHSGLLPDYRGVMATFWALLNDETAVGTTLHYISDSSIDTGAIIAQSSLTVDRQRDYLWHVLQLYHTGCPLILDAISIIAQGKRIEQSPQKNQGQYYSFPNQNDLIAFTEKGFRLVDEVTLIAFLKSHYY